MWDFCLFGFFLFLKLTDSSVKYIVKEFAHLWLKVPRGFCVLCHLLLTATWWGAVVNPLRR